MGRLHKPGRGSSRVITIAVRGPSGGISVGLTRSRAQHLVATLQRLIEAWQVESTAPRPTDDELHLERRPVERPRAPGVPRGRTSPP